MALIKREDQYALWKWRITTQQRYLLHYIFSILSSHPIKIEVQEGQRFSLFMMEYGRTLLKPPIETVTMVFDMTEAGMKNMDLKSLQFTIQSLQNYYPESLGKVLVYNSSWVSAYITSSTYLPYMCSSFLIICSLYTESGRWWSHG